MARRNKRQIIEASGFGDKSEEEVVYCSSDDSEANADLTLRIAERASHNRAQRLGTAETGKSCYPEENADDKLVLRWGKKTSKKLKKQKVPCFAKENHESTVKTLTNPVSKVEDVKVAEPSDDSMLRRLLRGPRYFDPPENGWMRCFYCGEDGHIAVNCTSVEKKHKPCFVCGSLDHLGWRCPNGVDCFFCKQTGHRAKDCPEKWNRLSNDMNICLKCGDYGHDMFSCRNPYSLDDLQQIQCYVCKRFGHLCCVKCVDDTKRIISCYKCGESGHDGPKCKYLCEDNTEACVKITEMSSRRGKRKPESKSASAVLDKGNRKRKPKNEKPGIPSEVKEKRKKKRGDWIRDVEEDSSLSWSKNGRYKSPSTPSKGESLWKNGYRHGGSSYRESEKGHASSRKGHYLQNYPEDAYNTPTSYRNDGYSEHSHSHSSVKNGFKRDYNDYRGDFSKSYDKRDRFDDDADGSRGNHFRSWSGKNRHFF